MKQELKPCHCGAEANLMYDDSTQVEMCYVECSKCLMATMQDTYENVINAWNTRADHSGESADISESQMIYEIAKDMMPLIYKQKAEIRAFQTIPQAHSMLTGAAIAASIAIKHINELINQLKKQNDEK